ncbi:MAG TPA: NAD(P)-dependent alcohol dehydrogenase [Gaiellaceae bacterium]|nr:NAD(P)-dependent alcohol dehydrogenase [Gaiellaceae bacterium]
MVTTETDEQTPLTGRADTSRTMRAVVRERYGFDGLAVRDVPRPELQEGGVLVRVRATSVNAAEWYAASGGMFIRLMGRSGLRTPKDPRLGADFAGIVEEVAADVDDLEVGDEVFGGTVGAYAEYVFAKKAVVRKPPNATFEEAGAVGIAGVTALQGLRDHGELQSGQRVLVNGATGGVGTFAVQIAKALGGEVTAVCSSAKVDLVASLGADRVLDYTRQDFTRSGERYDLILDVAGSQPWRALQRVLEPNGRFVSVGAGSVSHNSVLGPLPKIAGLAVAGRLRGGGRSRFFIAKFTKEDMRFLADLMADGRLKPVVEQTYDLAQVRQALDHLGRGHARGKIVLTV